MSEYTSDFIDVVAEFWYDSKAIDRYNPAEYNKIIDAGGNNADVTADIDLGEEYQPLESGELNGYEQNSDSRKLGWHEDSSEIERYNRVGEVGYSKPQKSDTPHTKRIHRSGVSAEVITSSGLTAEQTTLKAQNKIEGIATEFYIEAKKSDKPKTDVFVTEATVYYPDSDFERSDIVSNGGVAAFTEKRFNDLIKEFSVPVGGYYSRFTKTLDGKSIPGFVFRSELSDDAVKIFNDFFSGNKINIKMRELSTNAESDRTDKEKGNEREIESRSSETRNKRLYEEIYNKNDIFREGSESDVDIYGEQSTSNRERN